MLDTYKRAALFLVYENPIFIPRKHTKQSYAQQNRIAKKRRKYMAKQPK